MAQHTRAGVYFCRNATRCVTSAPGSEGHRFLVGTCCLNQPNEIHVVEFSDETSEIACKQVLSHEDEIWLLNTSPDGQDLLTFTEGKSEPALRLWRVSEPDAPTSGLDLIATFTDQDSPLTKVKSALWDPHNADNMIVADAETGTLRVFQQSSGGYSRVTSLSVGTRSNAAAVDPHHAQQVSTVDDTHLKTWDLRAQKVVYKRDGVHLFGARDVDYNPNVPYQVMTTGEDATIKFWDLRNMSESQLTLAGGHHHWITRARYNSHHDQLLLTSGTDSAACLWRAGSVASKPLSTEADGGGKRQPSDGLIRRFGEHEDSVYSCCWSALDAWIFASVSYDGKLVVNRVPDEEKYRIIL